ncbi:probable CCR4-associated factor 1 homolog 11 [Lolium rigidum]|uniref:probable CCR4-associated factor 1 homolog 11 n=1 Tax=Lolium rigidum TaxID=89674 RepID=UPI001F5D27BC|nr:probable CCR4-associated factor 1 homolog 11 [Lolium rigidum]
MFSMFPPPPASFHGRVPPAQTTDHPVPMPAPHVPVLVHPVWAWSFHQEAARLRHFAEGARYVAVNVHYPGLVHHPGKDQDALTDEKRYPILKANVDALKPLQVGIAVCDRDGKSEAWEFNLRDFRRHSDPHDASSLAYLAGRGLDVDTFANHGVDAWSLGAMLLSYSGLIGPWRGLSWVTYTGAYHVAYLLKIVTGGCPLPNDVAGFVSAVRHFLGDQVYDVAGMAADCPKLPVGLERIAAHLGFHPPWNSPRLAAAAGVRALQVFRSLEDGELRGKVSRYRGLLQGLHH